MKNNRKSSNDDMSDTFIGDIGQKSAIAEPDSEEFEIPIKDLNFPDVKIEPPKSNISLDKGDSDNLERDDESIIYKKPRKRNNPILTIFLMLLCLVIGIGGTYYYFEVLNKDAAKTDKKTTINKNEQIEVNPNSVFAKKMIERYDYSLISNIDIYRELYLNEKTTPMTMDESYIRHLIAIETNHTLTGAYFTSDEFQDSQKMLFGTKISLEDKTIGENTCDQVKYNSDSKIYEYVESDGCGGTADRSIERKIVKGSKSNKKLEITVAVAILTSDGKVYKAEDSEHNLIDELSDTNADSFDINSDYSKLNQFKYNFDYDNEEDNYTLNSIELVK